MPKYDIVIIGAGPGGYVAAVRAAQLGARTALVESEHVGGTCLNWGCIPTKTLIKSGRVAALARKAGDFGVNVGEVAIDYGVMSARKDKVVGILRGGIENLLEARKVDVVRGRGKLTSPTTVEVAPAEGEPLTLEAANIIVATGSEPAKPKVFPFDGDRIVTSEEAVVKTEVGKSVLIVGGGFIGCEYASLYANLGLEVTVVELLDNILATMDASVIKSVTRGLKRRKVKVKTGTKVESLETTGDGVKAALSGGAEVTADFALISVGRVPVTANLGLEEAGVEIERGYVKVDDRCRTSVETIWAIGDITGQLQLAHVASEQGVVAVANIMGQDVAMDYSAIPACVFTDPEAATVGLTEAQAAEKGFDIKTGEFDFRVLGKAHSDGEIEGSVKVVVNAADDRVLGVHIVGHGASEIIAEAALAVKTGATAEEIIATVHAHPTLPEAFKESLEAAHGMAIHLP